MSFGRGTTLDMRALFVVAFALLSNVAFAEIVDGKRLEQAVQALPGIKLDQISVAQLVASTIETDLDPFVLLAQAYVESRFDSTATSRLIDGKRFTGPWVSRKAPAGWSGTLYCGITQTVALTWSRCLALREPSAAIEAQAVELRTWLQSTHGDLIRSIAAYGCGNWGARTGRCNGYPRRVLAWAQRLRRATLVVPLS
jgi:hypothetical protein